ncbi:unnamed protein product, partial [Rotaria sp. Silwood2]
MDGDITGALNFFSHTIDGSPPWMDGNPKLGWLSSNFAQTPVRITIHDLRGKENIIDLDTNGFEILKYDGDIHDEFNDNSETQQHYYEEITNVLKKRLDASRVIIYNHITRYRGPPHYDPPAAHFKVKQMLGEEVANRVMQKRFQIINVWRPLGPNPIMNTPLTICDYRSLDLDNDLHVSEIRNSLVTIALYIISHNSRDAQKWYYLSNMRSNE